MAEDRNYDQERNANVTGSGLGQAVSKMRNIQVALEARAKEGEELDKFLRDKLEKNLKVQLTDNLLMRRQSVKEMKMIRDEMMRGNLKVTKDERDRFAALYNRAIEESVKSNSVLAETASSFALSVKGNMPSLDNILGAISVANPVVGFGMKLTKDLISMATTRKRAFEEERKESLKNLEQEARANEAQEEAAQEVKKEQKAQSEVRKRDTSRTETQKEWLRRIHGVMERVRTNTEDLIIASGGEVRSDNIGSAANDSSFERIASSQDILHDDLERVEKNTSDLVKISEESLKNQELERISGLEASREDKREGFDYSPSSIKKSEDEGFGDAGGMFGGLGRIAKSVFGPIGRLFKGLLKLSRFIPHAAVIGAVVTGAMGIFDGFNNAAKILDKNEVDVDIGDKIAASIGSIFGSISGLIDWVAGLLGFETNIEETVTKAVAKFSANLKDKALSFVKDTFSVITGLFDDATKALERALEWVDSGAEGIGNFFSNWWNGEDEKQPIESKLGNANMRERMRRSKNIDTLTDSQRAMNANGASPVVAAPVTNNVDNSTSQMLNVPRTSRNDDRTMTRIHNLATAGAS